MQDFLFLLRAFVLTVVTVLILQVKVGDKTLEQKSEAWLRGSVLVDFFQGVSDGAVMAIHRTANRVSTFLDEKLSRKDAKKQVSQKVAAAKEDLNQAGKRHMQLSLERSKEFVKEKATEAKEVVQEGVENLHEEFVEDTLPLEEE